MWKKLQEADQSNNLIVVTFEFKGWGELVNWWLQNVGEDPGFFLKGTKGFDQPIFEVPKLCLCTVSAFFTPSNPEFQAQAENPRHRLVARGKKHFQKHGNRGN